MTAFYWIWEYTKVFLAYGVIMFVWPSLMFAKFLRGKKFTFRFGFCVTGSVLMINTGVLLMGLFHLLYGWLICLIFYGSLAFGLMRKLRKQTKGKGYLKKLMTGTYGSKQFVADVNHKWGKYLLMRIKRLIKRTNGYVAEYTLLSVVVIFGMIYFTYGAFQDYSYGFGDMYPHNAWIYGLTNGQIFSAGVYPEGMHCFIYFMHTLFGIRIYSCMLFTAGIHVAVFLISAYLLLKELFKWRFTALIALALFLCMDVKCVDEVYSMSRLQWTIPQEFGFYTIWLCATFLLRYLKAEITECKLKFRMFKKGFWDENLFLFVLALATSLAIHFYCTIMAFFLCLAFVPLMLHKILQTKRLVPLVVSVMAGVLIAVIPMGGALASGIPFQGSIGWAVNVMNGVDGANEGQSGNESTTTNDGQDGSGSQSGYAVQNTDQVLQGNETTDIATDTEQTKSEAVVKAKRKPFFQTLNSASYRTLYGGDRAELLITMTFVCLAIWLLLKAAVLVLKYFRQKDEVVPSMFDGYFGLTLSTVFFMIMYCAGSLGLPPLVAGSRVCSVAQLLMMAMVVIPVDLVAFALANFLHAAIMSVLAFASVAAVYIITNLTGCFHGYLYYELTRYNAAVMSAYSITKELPKQSFTVVSTVDELYQVVQYGYHEEMISFVNGSISDNYTIPTEYVFIFVEKKPIQYAQSHFFEGPDWLAEEKYTQYYHSYMSQCPEITASEISLELGQTNRAKVRNHSSVYSHLETRTLVESRTYAWCKDFEELYPHELHVYYEDDDFVCYYFKQNPKRLFQLAIE